MKFTEPSAESSQIIGDPEAAANIENVKLEAKNNAQEALAKLLVQRGEIKIDGPDSDDVYMVFALQFARAFGDYYATMPQFRDFVSEHNGDLSSLTQDNLEHLIGYVLDHPASKQEKDAVDDLLSKYTSGSTTH